ncbi:MULTISPECIES: MFS transporter [unclassified Rhodococcus (in: high G+C Gram-positive bacteria)]|jgi:DHA2 family multidrug resistance protein-like MFS transporter|uniref:MFS transporter n=1 Tax=unclassified Rhodococcus (in: high G+C Gram-positive bacteria) TaxID=192944 RepID=UPI00056B926E|nr:MULTISPECIES: MFS transporter [unclassified Rhodococcus (in: high G+C Gram-positive bacteria)]KQU28212.1 MFS transporter [Rhodococcus sp. Leaf225]KQU46322.1 MFS transporter [Rhodococcus sp. Leaf258]MDQ1182100.1 DHA2 family multidrug resistance protein-like MFS transporter [Rhodococcus sp. SORGH_AS_0301]
MALHQAPPTTSLSGRGRALALLVICAAELLVVLDNTIVNVALPSIGVELQTSMSGLQWVVDAYTLTFAGFLLALGHFGDRYGRRRVMIIGLLGVAALSVVGALSSDLGQVIAARAVMGVFAAAVFPATLAMIITIFTDPREKALAIAAWTAMAGFAIAIGPTAGGYLLEHFSWHSVFWINVPVALVVALAARVLVPESRAEHVGRFDVVGLVSSLVAITALVWTIIEAPHRGWLSATSLAGYALSAVAIAGFLAWEKRTAAPVLDLTLFANRRFSLPALSIAVGYFSMFGFLFMITQYFQGVREYSPLEFGLHSLPFAVAVGVGAPIATLIAQRFGATAVIVLGLLIVSTGMAIAGQTTVDTPYVGPVLLSMVLMGLGLAVVQGPATDSIMSAVDLDGAGAGSAVNDTTREIGGTLGVAVLGSIVASVYSARVTPLVDAVPSSLMTDGEKGFASETVIAVIEMAKRPTPSLFEQQKAELILAMKSASLEGFQFASYVTVSACLACAVAVAICMPWKPAADSVLAAARTRRR